MDRSTEAARVHLTLEPGLGNLEPAARLRLVGDLEFVELAQVVIAEVLARMPRWATELGDAYPGTAREGANP